MQHPASNDILVPQDARAPPQFDAIEDGSLADGLTRAPLDMRHLEAKATKPPRRKRSRAKTANTTTPLLPVVTSHQLEEPQTKRARTEFATR